MVSTQDPSDHAQQQTSVAINLLYDLNDIPFDLPIGQGNGVAIDTTNVLSNPYNSRVLYDHQPALDVEYTSGISQLHSIDMTSVNIYASVLDETVSQHTPIHDSNSTIGNFASDSDYRSSLSSIVLSHKIKNELFDGILILITLIYYLSFK